jgi:hypothetical protein
VKFASIDYMIDAKNLHEGRLESQTSMVPFSFLKDDPLVFNEIDFTYFLSQYLKSFICPS